MSLWAGGRVAEGAWRVFPDGSGDAPTIQAAVDSASVADTIVVEPGVYFENIDTKWKWLRFHGAQGPEATVIDGQGRGSVFRMAVGGIIRGLTIRNGYAQLGGGVHVDRDGLDVPYARGVIEDNIIEQNVATSSLGTGWGGGIFLGRSVRNFVIRKNLIRANFASSDGGGVFDDSWCCSLSGNLVSSNWCHVSGGGIRGGLGATITANVVIENVADNFGGGIAEGAVLRNNTVLGNSTANAFAPHGTGIHVSFSASILNNISCLNHGPTGTQYGSGIFGRNFSESSNGIVSCNDSWGNSGTNIYVEGYFDTTGLGNISLDPDFCDRETEDFHLASNSPCREGGVAGCPLMGALDVGCGPTAVQGITWGRLKAMFGPGRGTAQ